jgi:hypothetical protein
MHMLLEMNEADNSGWVMYSVETIIYFLIFLILVSMIIIANQVKKKFSNDVIKNYSIISLLLSLVPFIVFIVIYILHYFVKKLFSISDGYNAASLTSSIVVAGATVIYAIFTYFILDATSKNTQQSALSIQQTANFQKREYLERSLQSFYLPMQRALKTINMRELRTNLDTNPLMERKNDSNEENSRISGIFKQLLIDMFLKYDEEYMTIMQFSYFATDKTNEYLTVFIDVYDDQIPDSGKLLDNFNKVKTWYFSERDNKSKYELAATDKTGFFNYYVLTKLQIEEDINSIKVQLAELVNQ